MASIQQELQELKSEFASLPDGFARYSYLAELSALLSPGRDLRREKYRYRGCQSQVWLRVWREGDRARLEADSDTLIIRGILYLMTAVLDNQPICDIMGSEFDLLAELNLAAHFSSARTTGVGGLLPEIKRRLSDHV